MSKPDSFARLLEYNKDVFDCNLGSLRIKGTQFPCSLKGNEFSFLRDYIKKYELKNGLEIGTGFGVSTVGCGLGFKSTNGKLISMDCYVEEGRPDCINYQSDIQINKDAQGHKIAKKLLKQFDLENTVRLEIGKSPQDIKKISENMRFDFVFIDSLHTETQLISELSEIIPFLDKKFVIFLHDTHCFKGDVTNYLIKNFGKSWMAATGCEYDNKSSVGGFNLGYINCLE